MPSNAKYEPRLDTADLYQVGTEIPNLEWNLATRICRGRGHVLSEKSFQTLFHFKKHLLSLASLVPLEVLRTKHAPSRHFVDMPIL